MTDSPTTTIKNTNAIYGVLNQKPSGGWVLDFIHVDTSGTDVVGILAFAANNLKYGELSKFFKKVCLTTKWLESISMVSLVSNEWKNAHYFVPTLSMFMADFGDPTLLYAEPKYGEYDGKPFGGADRHFSTRELALDWAVRHMSHHFGLCVVLDISEPENEVFRFCANQEEGFNFAERDDNGDLVPVHVPSMKWVKATEMDLANMAFHGMVD